nr:ATP-binding cassette domain-containing protein [Enterococcus sp.]
MKTELIRVENATKIFRSKNWRGAVTEVRALDDINLAIYRGETLGLVGESGSGKTTLGRSLLSLETLTEGQVFFEGQELTNLATAERKSIYQKMQIIFQDP